MYRAAYGLLSVSLMSVAILGCAPLKNNQAASRSGLSSVTIGEFKADGKTVDWKSGHIQFKKSGGMVPVDKLFKSDSATLESTVPYGVYEVVLEYYADEMGKTLLYKNCLSKDNKPESYDIFVEAKTLEIEICDASGKIIGETAAASKVTVTPKARTASSPAQTSTNSTGTTAGTASTQGTQTMSNPVVSFSASSKSLTASSIEVSYMIQNASTQAVYCHYRPLITFKDASGNFGVEVAAPVKIEAGAILSVAALSFTGATVFGEAGKDKLPVLIDSKLYGVCRATADEASKAFSASCTKESSVDCNSFMAK